MKKEDLKIGHVVKTGLCHGFSGMDTVDLPLMVANVKDLPITKNNVELVGIVNSPETFVLANDIEGIRLNEFILNRLGFIEIDPANANCFSGNIQKAYKATIEGRDIEIVLDKSDNYALACGKSRPLEYISYVHEIQNNVTVNGKILPISYSIFYDIK
ncbi:hypothetical protein [Bacteroides congonensis]|uniref:hypothetical protein n=1 Tax=Bacteroides congonensis TaxID=1871006 RepID=UPI00189A6FE2|nr:hypothetical protein [Bacteroides congonensis]